MGVRQAMQAERDPTAEQTTDIAAEAITELTRQNRHGIEIFLSRENFTYFITASVLIFLPAVAVLAVTPVWEWFGELDVIRFVDHLIAPAIESISFEYRAKAFANFPVKRFMVGASTILLLIYAANFVPFALKYQRKKLALIWTEFDHVKILQYFLTSGIVCIAIWLLFFCFPQVLAYLAAIKVRRNPVFGIVFYAVVLMPISTAVFGRLSAIALIGGLRSVRHVWRRLRAGLR